MTLKYGMLTKPSRDIIKEIISAKRLGFDYVELGMEMPEGHPDTLRRKRKEILKDLTGFIKDGAELLEKSEEKLGMDDPVYDRLRSAMAGLLNAYQHIDDYIEKGKVIEEFD